MSRDCTRAPLGFDMSGSAVSPALRVVSTSTGVLSLPCEAARLERVLGVSPDAVAAVVSSIAVGAAVVSSVAAGAAVVSSVAAGAAVVSSVAAGAAVVPSVAAGATVVSVSVVAWAVVAGATAVVVASAAVADTSSAATAFVAKIVVPNKTEHTPIVNLRNEKR